MRDIAGAQAALDQLKVHSDIAMAIEAGDKKKLYELLQRKRGSATDGEKPLFDRVLSERRLFLLPLGGAPGMSTINGVGTRLLGESERDAEDGTYVATLCFTMLFVPVFPIRQYLVSKASDGVLNSSFYFLGRIPTSRLVKLWRMSALIGAALMATSIAAGIIDTNTHADVHFANALPIPVEIQVGEQTFKVLAGERQKQRLEAGHHKMIARSGDRVIDQIEVDLPGNIDVAVFNVLGAAPLYAEPIVYYSGRPPPDDGKDRSTVHAGQSWYARDDIDFVFRDPPATMSMSKSQKSITRWLMNLAPGGWESTVEMLELRGKGARAAQLLADLTFLQEEPDEYLAFRAITAHRQHAPDRLLALTDRLIAAAPKNFVFHTNRQDAALDAGKREDVVVEYSKLLEAAAEPDRPFFTALLARLDPPREALARLQPLAASNADLEHVQLGVALSHHRLLQPKEAVQAFERAFALVGPQSALFLESYLSDLVRLDRGAEALQALRIRIEDDQGGWWYGVALHEQLATKLGAPIDPELRARLTGQRENIDAYLDSRLGQNIEQAAIDQGLRAAWSADAAMRSDPDAALTLIAQTNQQARLQLADATVLLALAELVSRGELDAAKLLAKHRGIPQRLFDATSRFIDRGERDIELSLMDPVEEGMLLFVRSRKIGGKEGAALLAEAKKRDVIGGVLSSAIASWR